MASDERQVHDNRAAQRFEMDVEGALAEGGTVGGRPAPGGVLTSIQVDGRSFILASCGAENSACPAGVVVLKTLLDRIQTEVSCTP